MNKNFANKSRNFLPASFQNIIAVLVVSMLSIYFASCKKLVEIDQPVNSITTEKVFSDRVTADAAVVGIYSKLINSGVKFSNGGVTLYTGLSSDELSAIGLPDPSNPLSQFYTNELFADNTYVNNLWTSAFFAIFQANSCIEGIQKSKSISADIANRLIGECKFLRAFSFFYLTNLWGDLPMPLTSDWNQTYLLHRASKTDVYKQIISDLKDAQSLLPDNYSISNNERIRPNRYSATALLARVYLYLKEWTDAESQATTVIDNSGTYTLVNDLNKVFLKNSSEAILQFGISSTPYATWEQYTLVQFSFSLTDNLLNTFDSSDQRKSAWITTDSTTNPGMPYSYPYKYKKRGGSPSNIPEYYMVLRLAEQYLIRAEARAQLNKITGSNSAETDLNVIRNRAGLPNTTANTQAQMIDAIMKERRVELFSEWGHRWFDLIRTETANTILSPIKGVSWQSRDQLFPIPASEILNNSNLTQNAGY
jgi:hypothetical protein